MPRVRQKVRDVLLVMVGANPPPWLVRQQKGDILVTGEITDPRPLLAGADVLVAPVFFGSGTRVKLLDYMALGKPIVSATKAAEGLEMQDGVHFLRADTVESFSEAIVRLFNDKQLARVLGYQARDLARKTYSWDAQVAKVLSAYARITEKQHS
jgi:glycosyltransferase involved in cell wall biosynthesis